jgi:hypothetical protein
MDSIEIFFITLFIYALYRKFIKKSKVVEISLKILILIGALYVPFTMWASSNTYNSAYLYEDGNQVTQDLDHDSISDTQDPDVGNSKEDNLEKVNSEELLMEAEEIMTSGKWTNQHSNRSIEKMKDLFGGFSSYRIISQAHYNLRLPIEPVLRDYHVKTYGFESYFYSDYKYPTLLFEYLDKKDMLRKIEMEEEISIVPGKIFFLVEKVDNEKSGNTEDEVKENLNILNLGITLEENYLAIVLEGDEYLTKHTYEKVEEIYNGKFILYVQN